MGDKRVIAAPERNVLHKVDSGAMRFKVKVPLPGLGPAVTFTAKNNPFTELYKIIIGRQTKMLNVCVPNQPVNSYTLENVDLHLFQGFWITWFNKKIRMGIWDEQVPFLVYPIDSESDHEIGFARFHTMSRGWAPVEWIIETPPVVFKQLEFKKFDVGLSWLPMENGRLPDGAMVGGFENEPTYIARANHNDSLCPGKYVPSKGLAYVPWGHREHSKREFEILCGYNAQWVKSCHNHIPSNAFIGGRSEVQNEPLYIGRAMCDGNLLTGKVHVRYKTCYLPLNGKEIEKSTYEILVIPDDVIPQAMYNSHKYIK